MIKKLFGTDGIRGRAGEEPLTSKTLKHLGRCLAVKIKTGNVILGHDGRESGEIITAAIAEGITEGGLDIDILGLATTPCVAYLTSCGDYKIGIMVSASHNPAEDNGIKFFGEHGSKLENETEKEIEDLIISQKVLPQAKTIGKAKRNHSLIGQYIAWMRNEAFPKLDFSGAKILVDCANGAASRIAPRLMRAFGADPVIINHMPNGHNINDACGALYPSIAAAHTQKQQCSLGLSLDGDADRAILNDCAGRTLDGDAILAGLAPHINNPSKAVVATVMSNLALEETLAKLGMQLKRTAVGDRHVAKAMQKGSHTLGGEKSGHILFGDEHGFRGDGFYTFLKVAQCLWDQGARGESFSDAGKIFAKNYRDLPQELRNLNAKQTEKIENLPNLKKEIGTINTLLGSKGRVVVRFSGTEKKLRLMVEAVNKNLVTKSLDSLQEAARRDDILK